MCDLICAAAGALTNITNTPHDDELHNNKSQLLHTKEGRLKVQVIEV
jgi:hypothetical protein